ncbi:MAG: hypothetical protein QXX30_02210, partial [Candidatus Aenigmatarchaeota archaeon]
MKGQVVILDQDKKLILRKSNLIVDQAKTIIAKLISGSDLSSNYVSKIALGTSDSLPDITDTSLGNEVARVLISNITFPSYDKVTFEGYVDNNTANGNTIKELGLFTNGDSQNPNGLLFARTTISPLTKDSTFS